MPRAVAKRAAAANRLALIRAFCALRRPSMRPRSHPVHNFFSYGKHGSARVAERRKQRANDVRLTRARHKISRQIIAETRNSSTFSRRREICARALADSRNFFAALRRRTLRVRVVAAESGA
jgi:hypothetical protein